MKKIPLIVVAVFVSISASAATHVVRVNADGSFSPAVVTIASGDTVEWTFSSPTDSIIPSTGTCAGIKAYAPGDPNDVTGPMPEAVSGIFTLSPLDAGFVV